MRYIDHLGLAVEKITRGPYFTSHTEEGTDPLEFLSAIHRKTVERPDHVNALWTVGAGTSDDDEVTVAVTGNGPTSEVNAHAIAYLMAAGSDLVHVFFEALVVCETWPLDSEPGRALSRLRDAMAPLLGDDGATDPTPPEG